MSLGMAIFVAAIMSAFFRFSPLFLTRLSLEKYKKSLTFLDYAGCAAIGSMIYLAVFPQDHHYSTLRSEFLFLGMNILILIIAFFISLKMKKPVITFGICILIYAALNLVLY